MDAINLRQYKKGRENDGNGVLDFADSCQTQRLHIQRAESHKTLRAESQGRDNKD